MGGQLSYRTYPDASAEKLTGQFQDSCEDARHEYGHGGYTGTIAEMHTIDKFFDECFPSQEAAYSFVQEGHNKWDDAWAVSYWEGEPTKAALRRQAQAHSAADKARAYHRKLEDSIHEAFKARKSDLVSCKGCGSKLCRGLLCGGNLAMVQCPLCHESLLSKTDQKRLAKAAGKMKDAQIAANRPIESKKTQKRWLVGGWCSS